MASRAFAAACRHFGVRHVRTKPYTPKTNGGAELHPDGHEGVGLCPALRDAGPAGRWLSGVDAHVQLAPARAALVPRPPINHLRMDRDNILTHHT